ncbi:MULTISPECIES: hypothetical protein [Streptomyces]|uniref:Uncharacterized protein n=1 Tax=Streptomyces lycii TaxID=2654337 RepID=A0ABQ7FG73_9ACTN|nr:MULTISPECIES: hypothetical protein [Streptomyces]KAF4406963.1 hypothetical protein GCU69_22225 [Streptomyces lycii]PGH48220.1 hypothetical protein CRI70_24320 [Streptomyces sp. Ru87]
MGVYECTLAALFAAWLLLCVLAQLRVAAPRVAPRLGRWDASLLVPRYNYFAPVPGVHDYHLLFRTRTRGREFGAWQEVSTEGRRRWWNFAWNPDRRCRKRLLDLAKELAHRDPACADPATVLSVPYLMLLRHVCAQAEPAERADIQFLIVTISGAGRDELPQPLFLSRPHEVG